VIGVLFIGGATILGAAKKRRARSCQEVEKLLRQAIAASESKTLTPQQAIEALEVSRPALNFIMKRCIDEAPSLTKIKFRKAFFTCSQLDETIARLKKKNPKLKHSLIAKELGVPVHTVSNALRRTGRCSEVGAKHFPLRTKRPIDCDELIRFMEKHDFVSTEEAASLLDRQRVVLDTALLPLKARRSPLCGTAISNRYIQGRLKALDRREPLRAITWAQNHVSDQEANKRCRDLLGLTKAELGFRGAARTLNRRTGVRSAFRVPSVSRGVQSSSPVAVKSMFFGRRLKDGSWKRGICKEYAEEAFEAVKLGSIMRGSVMPKWPEEDLRLHLAETGRQPTAIENMRVL
jgi:hypothetical protein